LIALFFKNRSVTSKNITSSLPHQELALALPFLQYDTAVCIIFSFTELLPMRCPAKEDYQKIMQKLDQSRTTSPVMITLPHTEFSMHKDAFVFFSLEYSMIQVDPIRHNGFKINTQNAQL